MPLKAFTAPSGRILSRDDLRLILALDRNRTVSWSNEEVSFNSGFKSHVYFRARNDLSHNLMLLEAVALRVKQELWKLDRNPARPWCLIGIPTAGTQLTQAISHICRDPTRYNGSLVVFSTMRSMLKAHGKDQMWVGEPEHGRYSYATVENVISTAKAMLEAFGRLEQDGYVTHEMHHVVFADWELGGTEALAKAGYEKVHRVFLMRDIIAALVHLGLWHQDCYNEMDRRIKAWRTQHGLPN